MKKLNLQDKQVMEDACRLLKSEFTKLYVKLGYDGSAVGLAWHSIRTSATGHDLMKKFSKGLPPGNAASSFIDVDEEAKYRLSKENKSITKDLVDDEDPNVEGSKAFNNANLESLLDGNKEQRAKSLIESGLTKAKALSQQGGFSIPYAYNMLKKYKQLVAL